MVARRQTLFGVALALLGAACSETTAPNEARATVVVPDTLVATRLTSSSSQWIQFNLPVSIHNTAAVPLTFLFCSSSVEVLNAGVWTTAWSPYCSLPGAGEQGLSILPGETRVVSVPVAAGVGGNAGPTWDNGTVSGSYRLTAALSPDRFSGTIPTISSNTFVLLQGQ